MSPHSTDPAQRKHVVLAELAQGDGGNLQLCVEKYTSAEILVVRFERLDDGIENLLKQIRTSSCGPIGYLDIVGHGRPGALEVGFDTDYPARVQTLTAAGASQSELLRLLEELPCDNGDVITPMDVATVVRLIGCNLVWGAQNPAMRSPAADEGRIFGFSVKQHLPARVQMSFSSIGAPDFAEPNGFADTTKLAEVLGGACLLFQAVAQSDTATVRSLALPWSFASPFLAQLQHAVMRVVQFLVPTDGSSRELAPVHTFAAELARAIADGKPLEFANLTGLLARGTTECHVLTDLNGATSWLTLSVHMPDTAQATLTLRVVEPSTGKLLLLGVRAAQVEAPTAA